MLPETGEIVLRGGRTVYGVPLGVIMLDTSFERFLGDVGHAATWPFAVRYEIVRSAEPRRIMGGRPDPELLEPFIAAARTLERAGVSMITTSCGFLAVFQEQLSAAVSTPVISSSLIQLRLAASVVGGHRRIAILTERANLTRAHLAGAGWPDEAPPPLIRSFGADAVFPQVHIDQTANATREQLQAELVDLATGTIKGHGDVAAFVFECSNFVPFSAAVAAATGRPVFDLWTAVMDSWRSVGPPSVL